MVAWVMGALLSPLASAQTVQIELDSEAVKAAGFDPAEVERDLGQAIEDQLRLLDPERYLGQMAEAASMSMKGMGVDYADNHKRLVFGLSAGTAVSGMPPGFGRGEELLPPGGYAAQLSAMAGINLGMLTSGDEGLLDRIRLYVNAMSFTPPTPEVFDGTFLNFGVHGSLKIFGPVRAAVLEFGGLDVTTGIERGSYRFRLGDSLQLSEDLGDGTVVWKGDGTYTLRAGSTSVPLELSTNLRILVLTVYGGAGVDLNRGRASSTAQLDGGVTLQRDGSITSLGDATVIVSAEGRSESLPLRAFAGAQLNILPVKIYVHANVGNNGSLGGHLGVRLVL